MTADKVSNTNTILRDTKRYTKKILFCPYVKCHRIFYETVTLNKRLNKCHS